MAYNPIVYILYFVWYFRIYFLLYYFYNVYYLGLVFLSSSAAAQFCRSGYRKLCGYCVSCYGVFMH